MEQFSDRMRSEIQTRAPILSARIYGHSSDSEDAPATHMTSSVDSQSEDDRWNWSDASKRLSEAYSEGGFSGWLEAATKELEREADIERRRKGLSVSQNKAAIK